MTFKVNYIDGNLTSQLYRLITFDKQMVFKRSDNNARLLSIVIRWVAGGSVSRDNVYECLYTTLTVWTR